MLVFLSYKYGVFVFVVSSVFLVDLSLLFYYFFCFCFCIFKMLTSLFFLIFLFEFLIKISRLLLGSFAMENGIEGVDFQVFFRFFHCILAVFLILFCWFIIIIFY